MGALDKTDIQLREKISKRITALRKATGKNQSAFSKEAQIDRQTQNRWEKGRGATIYTINKLCIEIGITLKEFFDDPMFK